MPNNERAKFIYWGMIELAPVCYERIGDHRKAAEEAYQMAETLWQRYRHEIIHPDQEEERASST